MKNGNNFEVVNFEPSELDALTSLIRRLTYEDWAAAEKVRMYAASPTRGVHEKSVDEKAE